MNPEIDTLSSCRAFNRAATHYDRVAILQQEVGARLLEHVLLIRRRPKVILDLGQGTGTLTQIIHTHFPEAIILGLDSAVNMSRVAQNRKPAVLQPCDWQMVCGTAQNLPFQANTIDLIISNCTLQWCEDIAAVFRECKRVLTKDGLLFFSTFGPDTLEELRDSFEQASPHPHVHRFIDMHDLGDALLHTQFAEPVMDMERLTLTYNTPEEVMRDLKTLGAVNHRTDRNKGLMTKRILDKVKNHYENYRNTQTKLIPATYEILYGHAVNPTEKLGQWQDKEGKIWLSIER